MLVWPLPHAGYYFIFWTVCFSAILVLSGVFRLVACVTPSMVIGNSVGSLVLLVLIITSGFAIVRSAIPGCVAALFGAGPEVFFSGIYIHPYAHAMRPSPLTSSSFAFLIYCVSL